MTKEEITKICLDRLEIIIDTAIELGYYPKDKKKELIGRIMTNVKKTTFDNSNPEIYGYFSSTNKSITLNPDVYHDELTLLIYFTHEFIHALDFDGKNNGFELEDETGIGINEGATQRKAENIAKKILNIKPKIKLQESIGCKLETDLDEYQIEDKFNQLYAKALGISFNTFLRLQGKSNGEGLRYLQELDSIYSSEIFDIFNSPSDIVSYIDIIYRLQEKTWYDKNYDVTENHLKSYIDEFGNICYGDGFRERDFYIEEIQNILLKIFVYRNIMEGKINNEEEYKTLVSDFINDFIIKDNSYLDSYDLYLKKFYGGMFIEYQNQYYDVESWLLANVDLNDKNLVTIKLEINDNVESLIKSGVEICYRENDNYYLQKINFNYDENGNLKYTFLDRKECTLENIVELNQENECDGNYLEYINIFEKLNNPIQAKRIAIRHKMYKKKQKMEKEKGDVVSNGMSDVMNMMEKIRMDLENESSNNIDDENIPKL